MDLCLSIQVYTLTQPGVANRLRHLHRLSPSAFFILSFAFFLSSLLPYLPCHILFPPSSSSSLLPLSILFVYSTDVYPLLTSLSPTMLCHSFLLIGAIALRASAVLVVPGFDGESAPSHDQLMGILPLSSHTPYYQQVDLLCTECPFRESGEDGKVSWTDGSQTSLVSLPLPVSLPRPIHRISLLTTLKSMNFSIDDSILLANGRQIFPPPPPARITAVQHRVLDGAESEPIPLGYALEVMPLAASSDEPGVELLSIRFTVLDLDGRPVPLNTVAIGLIHDGKGNFYIAKTEIEETAPDHASWKQCRGKPTCLRKLLLGRIRGLIASAKARIIGMASKVSGSKGCHGRPIPRPDGDSPDSPFWAQGHPDHTNPAHGGHPRPYMHHMHHAGWERTVLRVVRFILIPATLGVLAGLTASALGMLFGQVIVSLWLRYRRSHPKQPSAHMEQGTEFEKQGLMVETRDDLPPAYVDDSCASEELPSEKD